MVVRVLLLDLLNQLVVLLLELLNRDVALLELLLNNFKFLGVCEGVLALYDLFQICAQPRALVHVHLDLDFGFVSAGVFYVSFEKLYLVVSLLQLEMLVPHLALQVRNQVVRAGLLSQGRARSFTLLLLLLLEQLVNHLVFAS